MGVWSEVPMHLVQERRRFDADYYSSEYLAVEDAVRRYGRFTTLGAVATRLFAKGIFDIKADEYVSNGIPFVRIADLKGCIIDTSSLVYVTPERSELDCRTELVYGDIVLSKTAYPAAAFVQLPKCNVSQDTIAVRTNRSTDYNCFLAVFLNGKYGLPQMQRLFRGNIQSHLGLNEARTVLVPEPAEGFLADLFSRFLEYVRLTELSRELYTSAADLIYSELSVSGLQNAQSISYEATLVDITEAARWDAQCFHPRFLTYQEAVEQHREVMPLGRIAAPPAKGVHHTETSEGVLPYASIKHVTDFEIVTDSRASPPDLSEAKAQRGDLLLAITGATIGKIGMVDRYATVAFSGDLLRLRAAQDVDPHYLLAVLGSDVGQRQLLRWVTGSTNGHLAPRDVMRTKIPRLEEREQVISDKVREALRRRQEAERLLRQTVARVEQLIEEEAKS